MGFLNLVYFTAVIGPASIDPSLFEASSRIVVPSKSEGDPCFSNYDCQNLKSFLYCSGKVCLCPVNFVEESSHLPINMVWDPQLRQCVSERNSFCNTYKPPYPFTQVLCRNNMTCQPAPHETDIVGTCGGLSISGTALFVVTCLIYTFWNT